MKRFLNLVFLLMLVFATVPTVLGNRIAIQGETQGAAQSKAPNLDAAYRAWHKGLSSGEKEGRSKALRSILPTKDDMNYLFPANSEKLWPLFDKGNQFLLSNVDAIAKEITSGGEIKTLTPNDVRNDKRLASGDYKRLLDLIPKDVQVYELIAESAKGSGGSGTFLLVKDRWIWIKDAYVIPDIIDKTK